MPLFVLGTPIGNLSDVSARMRDVLEEADLVVAEDTRVTRKLFSALGIPAPRIERYRGHEQARNLRPLLKRVEAGERVVLVSDAGLPAVSDPGVEFARACHDRGLPVHAVPGPSAVASAISVSGLPPTPFHFLGFPPRKPGPIRRWVRLYASLPGTLVLYESPRRVVALAEIMAEELPDRVACLCRELTKRHEEVLLLPVQALWEDLRAREEIKGEVTLVIGPGLPPKKESVEVGTDLRSIAAALAERWGVPKREAYQRLLALELESEEEPTDESRR
jgi:16S rRNA (cytidine1402-2'-O)-methyltransferase